MTSFQFCIDDSFLDFSHTQHCYGNEKCYSDLANSFSGLKSFTPLYQTISTVTGASDVCHQIMKSIFSTPTVPIFSEYTAKATGKKVSWQEALAISVRILEKAEQERNMIADKEAKIAAFWDSDE